MRNVKLCGFDVNGFRDLAARNWISRPGEDEKFGGEHIGQGGLLSSVVLAGDGVGKRWIGGKQAELAPHGRGDGWGRVGHVDRRVSTRSLLSGKVINPDAFGAAFTGLVQGASVNVAAIEEGASLPEAYQDRIRKGLEQARVSNPMLIWRSVLAVLYRLQKGDVPANSSIGVIGHGPGGISLQKLRVLQYSGRGTRSILAPERRNSARVIAPEYGFSNLAILAEDLICGDTKASIRVAEKKYSHSLGCLTMGEKTSVEVLRAANKDWEVFRPPAALNLAFAPLNISDFSDLDDCDEILFESLADGSVRNFALNACQAASGRTLTELPFDAVAKGALEAARRLSLGDPVYFDFLPKISTIVFSDGQAESFDLVDDTETVEAGRLYRSAKPAKLALPAGKKELSIYIKKEAEAYPRVATVGVGAPLADAGPVSLLVEQKPASGRARILLEARHIGRQFTIEWDDATIVKKKWDDIIISLHSPPPSFPKRLVLHSGIQGWEASSRGPGLSELIEINVQRPTPDWESLAAQLSAKSQEKYCVSTDGDLPEGLAPQSVEQLGRLTQRALYETRSRLAGSLVSDNAALKFLTWQFRRCPQSIADMLLDCIFHRGSQKSEHTFVINSSSLVLIYQGAARIISTPENESQLIDAILVQPIEKWSWRIETASLSFLLSRSQTAPELLTRQQIETIARRVHFEFLQEVGTDYTRFFYAPFLLAGILRYRAKEPRALVAGSGPFGDLLADGVKKVLHDFESRSIRTPRFKKAVERYKPLLIDLQKELEGNGTNPDILSTIYNA